MNILLINDYLEAGGAEAVFRAQHEILKRTHAVHLFYAFETLSDRKISPISYIYSFKFKHRLSSFLRDRHFQCIIVHNYNNALSPSILDVLDKYKKREKCKLIYYAHDFHLVCPNRGYAHFEKKQMINFQTPPNLFSILTKKLDYRSGFHSSLKKIQWILSYTIRKKQQVFDQILTPSDFLSSQIRLLYPELDIKRVYNSCNALKNTNAEKTDGFCTNKKEKINLVYFGRIAPEKGLAEFIKALKFSQVNYTFTMIGGGSESEAIEELIITEQLQHKIFLKSSMNHSDLFAELVNYDVFVLPSRWYENAPLSILEAASLGLGLFLSNHGGVLEMGKICNASHFFNPFDSTDIVSKLDLLYQDFLEGSLPEADKGLLQLLFSNETYIKNIENLFVTS